MPLDHMAISRYLWKHKRIRLSQFWFDVAPRRWPNIKSTLGKCLVFDKILADRLWGSELAACCRKHLLMSIHIVHCALKLYLPLIPSPVHSCNNNLQIGRSLLFCGVKTNSSNWLLFTNQLLLFVFILRYWRWTSTIQPAWSDIVYVERQTAVTTHL